MTPYKVNFSLTRLSCSHPIFDTHPSSVKVVYISTYIPRCKTDVVYLSMQTRPDQNRTSCACHQNGHCNHHHGGTEAAAIAIPSCQLFQVCAALLDHSEFTVRSALDCFGRTALHYAARGGHPEVQLVVDVVGLRGHGFRQMNSRWDGVCNHGIVLGPYSMWEDFAVHTCLVGCYN